MLVPNGTTAQRPTGATGYTRYNTDLNILEFYNGTTWIGCGFRDVDVTGSRTSAAFETHWCNTVNVWVYCYTSQTIRKDACKIPDVAKTFDPK